MPPKKQQSGDQPPAGRPSTNPESTIQQSSDQEPAKKKPKVSEANEPHFALVTSSGTSTDKRRTFDGVKSLDDFTDQELKDACGSVNLSTRGRRSDIIARLTAQYNTTGVVESLHEELKSLGLIATGQDGFKLRKRIDQYGRLGLTQFDLDEMRKSVKRRNLAYKAGDTKCALLLRVLQYEVAVARENCGWSWYLVEESEEQKKKREEEKKKREEEERKKQNAKHDKYVRGVEAKLVKKMFIEGLNGHEKQRFRQTNVQGDGNCMFRAFSHAWFGNESRHRRVRADAFQTWRDVMTSAGDLATRRKDLYSTLEKQTSNSTKPEEPVDSRNAPVSQQLPNNTYWGSDEVLQVLADTYGVQVFSFSPWVSPEDKERLTLIWEVRIRGDDIDTNNQPTPQVFLMNYRNYVGGHWTAITPVDQKGQPSSGFRFTGHFKYKDLDFVLSPVPEITQPSPLARRQRTGPNDRAPNYLLHPANSSGNTNGKANGKSGSRGSGPKKISAQAAAKPTGVSKGEKKATSSVGARRSARLAKGQSSSGDGAAKS